MCRIADSSRTCRHFREVPIADIADLFDHLVSKCKHLVRNGETKRPCLRATSESNLAIWRLFDARGALYLDRSRAHTRRGLVFTQPRPKAEAEAWVRTAVEFRFSKPPTKPERQRLQVTQVTSAKIVQIISVAHCSTTQPVRSTGPEASRHGQE